MAERDRIARYFAPLAQGEPGSFNLADDAALLTPPTGSSLIVTTDSVIETIHLLANAIPSQFAQKLMRRNLSDLAAMGATPWRYTLNLHTPRGLNEDWFAAFSETLRREQEHFGLVLVGGDSTAGLAHCAIHLTMTCFGLIEGKPLSRSGAAAGDNLYVSGSLGDAAYALRLLQQNAALDPALAARYHTPEPRLELGKQLRGIVSAAIDISDGFIADLGQLCTASRVGATLARQAIPRLPMLQHSLETDPTIWQLVLNGGDDYELCFTAPKSAHATLAGLAKKLDLPLTLIGEMTEDLTIQLIDEKGEPVTVSSQGWEYD